MTTKRRLALLSSLAATPAFAAPFLAIGDNAELYLTARTEARYEDNVTFASDTPEDPVIDDVVLEFVPGAEILFGKNSLTSGSVAFYERFLEYIDHDEFDEELANFVFDASYEGAKLRAVADASFRELNQNSRDEDANGVLVRRDVTNLGVGGELSATEKSKIGVAARYNKVDYKTANFVDREVYIFPVNYYFAITPKVDLSAGVQYRINDIDAANQDSDQVYYNVGARGDFTAKLTGSFSVGYSTREADSGDDDSTVGLKAGLVYLYSPKTQFNLDLSNDFESSSSGGGQEVASVNFGIRSAIAAGLTATASVGYKQVEYLAPADREDDYLTALIGFTYTVNQYMSVDVYYNYLDNSSDQDTAEFEANIVSVAANFRY
jgi:polysaccharide biosynthesis protein VpsM